MIIISFVFNTYGVWNFVGFVSTMCFCVTYICAGCSSCGGDILALDRI